MAGRGAVLEFNGKPPMAFDGLARPAIGVTPDHASRSLILHEKFGFSVYTAVTLFGWSVT